MPNSPTNKNVGLVVIKNWHSWVHGEKAIYKCLGQKMSLRFTIIYVKLGKYKVQQKDFFPISTFIRNCEVKLIIRRYLKIKIETETGRNLFKCSSMNYSVKLQVR